MSEADEIVTMDYEKEYKMLREQIYEIKCEHEKQLIGIEKSHKELISIKDKEIQWLKSVINGILHI